MPRSIRKVIERPFYISGAIVDPKGEGFLQLMFENANVPEKYRYLFYPESNDAIFIDCGANVGLITDIARFMDMEVYAFEPNPNAIRLLNKKYINDDKVHIYSKAVSNKNGKMFFYLDNLFDQGATIIEECVGIEGGKKGKVLVDIVKLSEIIKKDILSKHKKIYILKLDVEGAEFDIINDIIDEGLYKNIDNIVVETHERFFKDGKKMLKNLKKRIEEKGITNIYLDWF